MKKAVYEAIRRVANTDSPERFSEMNETVYEVAMAALRIYGETRP